MRQETGESEETSGPVGSGNDRKESSTRLLLLLLLDQSSQIVRSSILRKFGIAHREILRHLRCLKQATLLQTSLNDNIFNSVEDSLHIVAVRRAGDMGVDGSIGILILGVENANNVVDSVVVAVVASVIGEIISQLNALDLVREQVAFVLRRGSLKFA